MVQLVKSLPVMLETRVQFLGQEDPLEKEMATPVFMPGEFHGQRAWRGIVHGVTKSQTQLSD